MGSLKDKFFLIYQSGKQKDADKLKEDLARQGGDADFLQPLYSPDFEDNDDHVESVSEEWETKVRDGGTLVVLQDDELINILNHDSCHGLLAALHKLGRKFRDKVVIVNYSQTEYCNQTGAMSILDKFDQVDSQDQQIIQKIFLMTKSPLVSMEGIGAALERNFQSLNTNSLREDIPVPMFVSLQGSINVEKVKDKDKTLSTSLGSAPSLNTDSVKGNPQQEQEKHHYTEQVIGGAEEFKPLDDISCEEKNKIAFNNAMPTEGSKNVKTGHPDGDTNDGEVDLSKGILCKSETKPITSLHITMRESDFLQKDQIRHDSGKKMRQEVQDADPTIQRTVLEEKNIVARPNDLKLPFRIDSTNGPVLPPLSPDAKGLTNDFSKKEKKKNKTPERPAEQQNIIPDETSISVTENDKVPYTIKRKTVGTQVSLPNVDHDTSADYNCTHSLGSGDGAPTSISYDMLLRDLPIDVFEYISDEMNHPVGKFYKDLAGLYGWSYDRLDKFNHKNKMTFPANHFASLLGEDEFKVYTYGQFINDMRRLPRKDILYGLKKRGYSCD